MSHDDQERRIEPQATANAENRGATTSPITGVEGIVASGNVALASRGATVSGKIRNPWAINDGKTPASWREYAKVALNEPITVKLNSVYQLTSIRVQFVDETAAYRYLVEVSPDGRSFDSVQDRRSAGRWNGWQEIGFSSRPVKATGFARLPPVISTEFVIHHCAGLWICLYRSSLECQIPFCFCGDGGSE